MSETLDRDVLLKEAENATGLTDFGGESFLEPLQKLLDCAAAEANFHEDGLQGFKFNIHRCLVNRLRFAEDLKKHPEILDEDVSDPIVIIGQARSGTTKTQRMMSAVPHVQKTDLWKLVNPAPFPDADPSGPDPRIAAFALGTLNSEGNEELAAGHVSTAAEPEEDVMLQEFTFESWVWPTTYFPGFAYTEWYHSRPQFEAYRYTRDLHRYLQWQDGGKNGRPWILKSPMHMGRLEELFAVYPAATVVMTHRNPMQALPSMCKVQELLWNVRNNPIDPATIGEYTLKNWSLVLQRHLEERDRLQLDDRIHDLQYDVVRSGPAEVYAEIFRQAGYPLDSEGMAAMLRWEKDNEQGRQGAWHYDIEYFGLTSEQVDKAYGPYIERFIQR